MADNELILTQCDGGVATLLLNRPAKRNALTVAMWAAIPALVARAEADVATKVLLLRGAGGVFAAGADIAEMPSVYGSEEAALANDSRIQAAMDAIEGCAKPVIAVIEGPCVGGGCGLALACDLRIGAIGSRYGITPAKLGLVYGAADARRLVQAVGLSRAKDILFTGRLLDADEAFRIGLLDRLVDAEGLDDAVAELTGQIVAASQFSVRSQKRILSALVDPEATQEHPLSRALFGAAFEGPDFQEGFAAFTGKRAPRFPTQ